MLTRVAAHGLNLSKLQSCPRPCQPWHYGFHADVEFENNAQLEALLHDLAPVTEELRVLGAYRRGQWNRHSPPYQGGDASASAGWGG